MTIIRSIVRYQKLQKKKNQQPYQNKNKNNII